MIARETDADHHLQVTAKQEGNAADDQKTSKASSSSASSWSRLKDPRIVRVSRAFGGKDRHSKVCTVRGLRDRRVRLSVPTAIQLYDLQERLGLNQPSKVVDWLLNAAKQEIDELPPLQMPSGTFIDHNFQSFLASHGGGTHPSNKLEGLRISGNINWDDPSEPSGSNAWDSDPLLRSKAKEVVARETSSEDKETWTRNEEGKQQSNFASFFPRSLGHSSSPSLGLLNTTVPYNSLMKWDPSNLSLSPLQQDFHHNFNAVPLPSTMSMPSGGPQQVLVYHQPGISATQPYNSLPSHIAGVAPEYFPKEINFQMLNSTSDNQLSNSLEPPIIHSSNQHGVGHFHLLSTATTKLLPTQNDRNDKEDDNNEFQSSR